MNDADPYRIVCQALNEESLRPYDELADRIGEAPQSRDHVVDGMPAELEVAVEWKDQAGGDIQLVVRLHGTSTWYTERCEERITIRRPQP